MGKQFLELTKLNLMFLKLLSAITYLNFANFAILISVLATKPTILNKMVPFERRKNDFKKFAKHNQHKFNIVRVKVEKQILHLYKFKYVFRPIGTRWTRWCCRKMNCINYFWYFTGPIQVRIYGKDGHHLEENYFISDGNITCQFHYVIEFQNLISPTCVFSEPGYYKENHFGIRLESILRVVQKSFPVII